MNSITYGVGYLLATLAVNVFSSGHYLLSEPKVKLNGPLNFGYTKNSDLLLMEITLKNISQSVTAVCLKYYNQDSWSPSEKVKVNIEKNTNEVKFMILKYLPYDKLVVDVELYNIEKEICDTANIAEGRDAKTLTQEWFSTNEVYYTLYIQNLKIYYNMKGYCLAPNPCEISVDLKNKCADKQTSPSFSCNLEASQYICTFTKPQYTLMYRFYQTYGNNSYNGPAPKMEVTTTKLYIKLELFDNNTSINIISPPSQNKKNSVNNIIWTKKLSLTAKDISEEDYSSMTKLSYSETKDVEYSCKEHEYKAKYLHVGFINIKENKISTYNKTSIKRKFKVVENGTILCCLYYVFRTSSFNKQEVHITRFVENKILLMYQSQESICTNITGSKEQTSTRQIDWLTYLVPSVLGICVLILTLYIVKQKYCCLNTHPAEETVEFSHPAEETVGLDNYATQNQVLYANLHLVRDENQPQRQNGEPHYANIVGVLHPLR